MIALGHLADLSRIVIDYQSQSQLDGQFAP
jgi:hypothetical protein